MIVFLPEVVVEFELSEVVAVSWVPLSLTPEVTVVTNCEDTTVTCDNSDDPGVVTVAGLVVSGSVTVLDIEVVVAEAALINFVMLVNLLINKNIYTCLMAKWLTSWHRV